MDADAQLDLLVVGHHDLQSKRAFHSMGKEECFMSMAPHDQQFLKSANIDFGGLENIGSTNLGTSLASLPIN